MPQPMAQMMRTHSYDININELPAKCREFEAHRRMGLWLIRALRGGESLRAASQCA